MQKRATAAQRGKGLPPAHPDASGVAVPDNGSLQEKQQQVRGPAKTSCGGKLQQEAHAVQSQAVPSLRCSVLQLLHHGNVLNRGDVLGLPSGSEMGIALRE
jgi:hypothetical protein